MRHPSRALLLGATLAAGLALAAPASGDIRRAIDLPVQADALRRAGVPDAEVQEAVRSAESHGLSAAEADEVLEESDKARKKNGEIDNLGSFVNDRLDEGLRGKELAAAIHAEHEARGKGKGKGKGQGKGKRRGGRRLDTFVPPRAKSLPAPPPPPSLLPPPPPVPLHALPFSAFPLHASQPRPLPPPPLPRAAASSAAPAAAAAASSAAKAASSSSAAAPAAAATRALSASAKRERRRRTLREAKAQPPAARSPPRPRSASPPSVRSPLRSPLRSPVVDDEFRIPPSPSEFVIPQGHFGPTYMRFLVRRVKHDIVKLGGAALAAYGKWDELSRTRWSVRRSWNYLLSVPELRKAILSTYDPPQTA